MGILGMQINTGGFSNNWEERYSQYNLLRLVGSWKDRFPEWREIGIWDACSGITGH